jgi:acyl-CoA thioester hydrolase
MQGSRTNPAFPEEPGAPDPLEARVRRRVAFSDTDPVGIVWFGRYAAYFEEAAAELGRRCGLSYEDFRQAGLRSVIARYTVDFLTPLLLDEEITVTARLHWTEAARLNTEYRIHGADGGLRTRAMTVQVFTSADDGRLCLVSPPLWTRCRDRWRRGEFAWSR